MLPHNRDLLGRFIKRTIGNSADCLVGFSEQVKESTAEGMELVEAILGVLRDQKASNRERSIAMVKLPANIKPPTIRWREPNFALLAA